MLTRIRHYRSLWGLTYTVSDIGAVLSVWWLVHWLFDPSPGRWMIVPTLVAALLFVILGRFTSLYVRLQAWSAGRELLSVLFIWSLALLLLVVSLRLFQISPGGVKNIDALVLALAPVAIGLVRMAIRLVRKSAHHLGISSRRVAIAGMNPLGSAVADRLLAAIDTHEMNLIGYYDDRPPKRTNRNQQSNHKLLGTFRDMVDAAHRGEIDMVLLTLPMGAEARIRWLLEHLSDTTVSVYIVPDVFVFEPLHSKWRVVAGLPTVSVYETPFYGVDGAVKRVVDLVLGVILLALLGLPMLVIGLLVRWTSPGPALFSQRRYGLDGREIRVRKFRTMTVCEDGPDVRQAGAGDSRITPLGRFLRKTSLDELPQLINVIEGTMSLVGPRPHAAAHNEQYRKLIGRYMLRHKVRPGITGLAQVEGFRGETETVEKMRRRVEFDHLYIRDWSFGLDLWILLRTLWVAWRQPQAY